MRPSVRRPAAQKERLSPQMDARSPAQERAHHSAKNEELTASARKQEVPVHEGIT
jgi:hypothetical protein